MLAGQGIFLPRNPLQSGLPRSSEPRGSRKYSHAPRKTVQTPPSTLNGGCNGASELGGGQSSSLTSARLASFYPNPPALPLNHSSSSHHDIEQGSHRFELPCRSAIKEDQGAHTPDDVQDARAPLRSTERLVHYLISDQTPVSGHNQHLSSRPAFGATLQEKADAARRAQNGWLERNFYEASQIANLRQAHLQAIKAKREELAEVDRQSKREIQEQRLQDLQRRAAAATERRAWEAQERRKEEADASAARRALIEQRDAERRRQAEEAEELRRERELANQARITAEAERRRLEFEEHLRAEAELAALLVAQIEAEEEARRREAEEAERRRRERERECAVCLERHDLGVMVEAPCAHWYCRGHLRGKGVPHSCSCILHLTSFKKLSRLRTFHERHSNAASNRCPYIYLRGTSPRNSASATTSWFWSFPPSTRSTAPAELAPPSSHPPRPVGQI
ncbi:hypothetical protein MMC24_001179 [Lignoscripta atroalba]|nr:hypothetical protein [Lignoscripta atroalba]